MFDTVVQNCSMRGTTLMAVSETGSLLEEEVFYSHTRLCLDCLLFKNDCHTQIFDIVKNPLAAEQKY